jgi:hypothetical protein
MKNPLSLILSFLALAAFTARADEPKAPAAPAAAPLVTGPSVTQTGDAPKEHTKGDKSAKKKKKKGGKRKGAAPAQATAPAAGTPPAK